MKEKNKEQTRKNIELRTAILADHVKPSAISFFETEKRKDLANRKTASRKEKTTNYGRERRFR